MSDQAQELIAKHRNHGVLLDTNLFLLYLVGLTGEHNIKRSPRVSSFEPTDFRILKALLKQFRKVWTTPHILTEVSNLAKLDGGRRDFLRRHLSALIPRFAENLAESKVLAKEPEFPFVGLADVGILNAAQAPMLVLTDDLDLTRHLANRQIDVLNFNHLRPLGWQS